MTTFKTNNITLPNKKRILTLLFIIVTVFLSSCGLHFRKDKFETGLLEIGQQTARYNCRQNINYQAYQDCITRIDKNYDEAYKGMK